MTSAATWTINVTGTSAQFNPMPANTNLYFNETLEIRCSDPTNPMDSPIIDEVIVYGDKNGAKDTHNVVGVWQSGTASPALSGKLGFPPSGGAQIIVTDTDGNVPVGTEIVYWLSVKGKRSNGSSWSVDPDLRLKPGART